MSAPSFSQRPSPGLVIVGTIVDTPTPRTLRVRRNHFCIVSPETGRITHLAPVGGRGNDALRILGDKYREYDVVWLLSSQFVCPGMIDTHCHAPQYRQMGSANNLPLVRSRGLLMVVGLAEQSNFSQ
jgi:guanine deaminase